MVTYSDALKLLREKALLYKGAIESVRLEDSVGRKIASEITSAVTVPAFDTSAMDGFAIRSSETKEASPENPLRFSIHGAIAAGDPVPLSLGGGVYEIMTGAPFPEGYDACVRQEDVVQFDGRVTITAPVGPSQNRRVMGEDFARGARVVSGGHTVRAEDVLCFASLGLTSLDVFRRIRVAVIATGKELVDYHQSPVAAQIRNSTTPFLVQALKSCDVRVFDSIGDDTEAFLNAIDQCGEFDLILTTGAISVGRFDFVTNALEKRGLVTYFRKARIRPGKPVLFGRLGEGPFVIGLPGNPVATATGFRFFVDPFLRALRRESVEVPVRARLRRPVHKVGDTTCFLRASLRGDEVEAHENQKASMTHTLLASNCWIALDAELPEDVPAGQVVDVFAF